MSDNIRTDKLLARSLTVCIAVLAVSVAAREARAWLTRNEVPPPTAVFEDQWDKALNVAAFATHPSAKIKLIEFVDFECPVCARAHTSLLELERAYGARLSVSFVHLPLSNHIHAMKGARAVECADQQGRARVAIGKLFVDRASLLLADTAAFARALGISDTGAFKRCLANSVGAWRINAGVAVADTLKVTATPTYFLNGWRYKGAVPVSHLKDAVDDLLEGKPPRHGSNNRSRAGK